MKTKFERARSDEQKEMRISEIVNATARLFEKLDYENISFAMIAKEADFTRSNLYKYFDSREEVFLELLKHDFKVWGNDLFKTFSEERKYSIDDFSSLWCNILKKHRRMLRLFALSATLLEKNCSNEALINYKRVLMEIVNPVSAIMGMAFPKLSDQQIFDFIVLQMALIGGLFQMSTALTDEQKEVIKNSDVEHVDINFDNYLKDALVVLLKGLAR